MIIAADKVITRADRKHLVDGAVVVRSGRILETGRTGLIIRKYPAHRVVRIDGAVLMPGLVNVHAHLELPPLFSSIRADAYSQWVLNLIRAKKHLDTDDYLTAARKNIASIIRSGTTMVADISTHGASLEVLVGSGMRAVVFREIISMGPSPFKLRGPRRGRASLLIQQGMSPHSPHTASETVLMAVRRMAVKFRMNISMHVAETKDELSLLRGKASGLDHLYAAAGWDTAWAPRERSSFEYLRRLGILGPKFLAVHAVHTDDADIVIIKRSGSCIAHCPRSNAALGVGKMPLARFLKAGIPVGLGTDSLASVDSLNLWDEMRYACRAHRSSGISAGDILRLATLSGARALGMGDKIGSLESGKKADIIAVPLPEKDTGELYSDLLRETKSCIMNMVNGNIIYLPLSAKRK
jgi:5-methylthioadenosine/S-adenosylhomocysteine deaminase